MKDKVNAAGLEIVLIFFVSIVSIVLIGALIWGIIEIFN